MALIGCRACKGHVSSEVKFCPRCGVSNPGQRSANLLIPIIIVVILLALIFIRSIDNKNVKSKVNPIRIDEFNESASQNNSAIFYHKTGKEKPLSSEVNARIGPSRLVKLVENCPACGDMDKPVWRVIESADGVEAKILVDAVAPAGVDGAIVPVFVAGIGRSPVVDGAPPLFFDCHGHFSNVDIHAVPQPAMSGSIADAIALVVCPIAKLKRPAVLAEREKSRVQDEQRVSALAETAANAANDKGIW